MFVDFLYLLLWRLTYLLPFSPHRGVVWGVLNKKSTSILDVGCYRGSVARLLNLHGNFHKVGLDIFEPNLQLCMQNGLYEGYILADAQFLPIRNRVFDLSICVEVIEHLQKRDGYLLIQELERVARIQTIITTPVGEYRLGLPPTGRSIARANPLQTHRSGWVPNEMRAMNYVVKSACAPKSLGKLGYFLSYVLPLVYLLRNLPELASHMMCTKNLRKDKEDLPKLKREG